MSSTCVEMEERLLVPALGINWVMANRAQPEAQTDHHEG